MTIRDNASCSAQACQFKHPTLSCNACAFMCVSEVEMEDHRQTQAHLNKTIIATAKRTDKNGDSNMIHCAPCNTYIRDIYWNVHLRNAGHRKNEAVATFDVALEEATKDKYGIIVKGDFNFGVIPAGSMQGTVAIGSILATDSSSRITLIDAELASAKAVMDRPSGFELVVHGGRRNIRLQDRVQLLFKDTQLQSQFIIARDLEGIVGDRVDHERLRPIAPYVPRPRIIRQPVLEVVEGVRPPAVKAIPYITPLPHAPIPNAFATALSAESMTAKVRSKFFPDEFNGSSYAQHFKHLLWAEEYQMERDLAIFDMVDVQMSTYPPFYVLQVPGLAEKRPSVLVGDRILVQAKGGRHGHWFEGGVHTVRKDEVNLRFDRSFRGWSRDQLFNIRFKLNRHPSRRQHQALDYIFAEDRILFPKSEDVPKGTAFKTEYTCGKSISSNESAPASSSQLNCKATSRLSTLYHLWTVRPGTGKTVTLVEAIQQLLKTSPTARILVSAPSNSAADNIAMRLRNLNHHELFRFYAPSRVKDHVPLELLDYTFTRSDGHFSVPPMARMKRFRVVVTTCVSASFVSGIGIPRGHYSHIFVDEAGQATEPEVFIAILTMADPTTNVILAGDPKQLGPIVRSKVASKLGLEMSYIERLMQLDDYNLTDGYGKSVVKLVKNFRSHESILKFPNERFYDGELVAMNGTKVNSFLGSSYLPNPEFPVVFHGLCGKDDREASSPSFFNIEEVLQVKAYVQRLRSDRKFPTTADDIGIIAPYVAQCRKIRTALRGVADDIKVGSVEEFQGQERRVIIISAVRSSTEFVEYDLRHTLGFVASPRRFNVAVTRAQSLLIIIGDPTVLSLDPLWRSFLNYIHQNDGWTGSPITWDPLVPVDEAGGYDKQIREAAQIDMNDFTRQMESLTLAGVDALGDDAANVDRPWRDVE